MKKLILLAGIAGFVSAAFTTPAHAQIVVGANLGSNSTALFAGISTSNTYTFAVSPNSGATSINGVTFTPIPTASFPAGSSVGGLTMNGTAEFSSTFPGNGPMGAFQYDSSNAAGDTLTFVATGLTIGNSYQMVFYNAQWTESALRTFDISMTGATTNYSFLGYSEDQFGTGNQFGLGGFHTVTVDYTANATSVGVTFTQLSDVSGYHFYGATNQLTAVIPEPTAFGLLAGGLTTLMVARRRRKA
jgi:hypothetical protein